MNQKRKLKGIADLYVVEDARKAETPKPQVTQDLDIQTPKRPDAQIPNLAVQMPNVDAQEANLNVQVSNLDTQKSSSPNVQASNNPSAQMPKQAQLPLVQSSRRYDDSQFKSRQGVERLNVRIPDELKLWTEVWCAQNRVKMYELVTSLLEKHRAEQLGVQQSKRPSAYHDQINRLIDQLIDIDPIKVYERLTGNTATEKDRADFLQVSKFDDLAIKHGIAYSVANARAPIKYFSYCLPAIQDAQAKQLGSRFEVEVWKLLESGKIKIDS
ncbi:MAG: hypothetical protein ACLGJB_06680 [Blastocatellia bacterium]